MTRIPLRRYGSLLGAYLRPQWSRVALLFALLFASISLQLVGPQIIRVFIDAARAGGSLRSLATAAVLYVALAFVSQAVAIANTYTAEYVAWTATNRLRGDLALHCLRLDLSFHNRRTPGEMIERVDGDVTALANFFSRFVISILGGGLLLVGALVALVQVDWRVGAALTLFAGTALAVLLRLRGLAEPHWKASRQASAEFFGFVGEVLAATEDVRSSGAVGWVMRRIAEHMRGWLRVTRRATLAGTTMWMTSTALFAGANALAFAVSALLWWQGAATIGTVYLIVQYTQLLRGPIEQIRSQMQDIQLASASIARIEELLDIRPRVVAADGIELPPGPLSIDLDGVTFAYDDEPVLRDVSLRVGAGKVLGLLGRTGSGKTTITRLLLRFHDPTEGSVRLGGVDLRDARLDGVRRRIGLVTQEVQLMHASLRDNLTLYDDAVDDARILGVLRDLGLDGWLERLPDGLDTQLAPSTSGFSAGEAQLLALGRVFLRDPGIVVMDEASSRADPATERLVHRATTRLLRGRTGVIVAHRLATVRDVDEIAIVEGGRLVEWGDRERLARDPASRFSSLLRAGLEAWNDETPAPQSDLSGVAGTMAAGPERDDG